MKKLVQNTGVRKWYGDEWLTIQDEANAVIEGFFGHYNTPFILSGCGVDGTTIAPGIVGLIHADGFKLCRFAGATGATFPIYLKPVKTEETRQYLDGATKPVAYVYAAETSATTGSGYLEIKADGSTPRFNDVVQDSNHRFCTDDEKGSYAGQAAAAVNTLRDGIAPERNTLEKLRVYLEGIIPSEVNLQDIYDYIDELSYLPEYKGRAELTGSAIDWNGKPERFKNITTPTQFSATNLEGNEGKMICLTVTGSGAATFTAEFEKMPGSPLPIVGETNYIQMRCVNGTSGSEKIIYSVAQLA